MAGLHSVVVVVPEHVQKSEVGGVDPTSSLNHQLLVTLHGISVGYSVRHVLQKISSILLAIDTQTENSVFCQVHIGLSVVSLLVGWI